MALLAAAALVVMLAVASSGGAASTTTAVYDLSGSATMFGQPLGCLDCLPPSSTASGTATCSVCLAGKPSSGSFSLNLGTIITFPPSPCRIKTISGTLSVTWDSGAVSTADMSGKFIDDKPILTLSGSIPPNDPVYPPGPIKMVLNNYPPSPCLSATNTVTGTLTISATG